MPGMTSLLARPGAPAVERQRGLYRAQTALLLPLLTRLLMRLQIIGEENVPQSGPIILVSNHVENWDPYLCNLALPRRAVHHFARADGMESRVLGTYWRLLGAIPADRKGLQAAFKILHAGGCVGVFPEGEIGPALRQAGHGAAVLAVRSGAPVVPVALWGTEQVHPSSVLRPPRVQIQFGTARRIAAGNERIEAISDNLMREIAAMLPPGYRGFYGGSEQPDRAPASERV
jgi:1-acyl-sn-glycerol-3-phosphate acyltransferase